MCDKVHILVSAIQIKNVKLQQEARNWIAKLLKTCVNRTDILITSLLYWLLNELFWCKESRKFTFRILEMKYIGAFQFYQFKPFAGPIVRSRLKLIKQIGIEQYLTFLIHSFKCMFCLSNALKPVTNWKMTYCNSTVKTCCSLTNI